MVSKIEAAERLAKMVERYNHEHGVLGLQDVVDACTAYRSASVPSDEELGRVAYATTGLTAQYEWNDLTDVQRRKWSEAAAAVREWVQRDGLTEEEREAICDEVCTWEDQYAEMRGSILRKLGHEPEPVWEWRSEYSWWGLYQHEQLVARVDLSSGGLAAKVWADVKLNQHQQPPLEYTSETWNIAEAKAWCEQQLREARQ